MIDNELKALVSLLDEPNESNYINIQNRILKYGAEIIPVLEEVWENSFNETIQQRIENIIHIINFKRIKLELSEWKNSDNSDLLKAFILLSQFKYPDLQADAITQKINNIKKDIWLEINPNLTALEQIKVLNHVFFDISSFKANKDNSRFFHYLFVNNVLDSKMGNPLSLGVLYLILAQSLHLPVYAVDLPQNFILCFTKGINLISKSDILFYINPFNKGIVFTYKEIDMYLKQMDIKPELQYFLPCKNNDIILLILNEMKSFFLKENDNLRSDEIDEFIEIIENFKT